jgi:hypothetical protein
MRQVLVILLLVLAVVPAQGRKRNEVTLKIAAEALDRALEKKDTIGLKQLLSPELRYGHSTGWIETRSELVANLYNGKLTYKSIQLSGRGVSTVIEGKTGLVREEVMVDILYDGKPVNMKLSVLQVWVFRKGGWILLGRQSTKI